nr:hypothetical protein [Tanacetum cinerariifolium]
VVQACDATNNELAIPPLQAHIAPPTILHPSSVLSLSPMFNSRDFLLPEKISPKDTETSESLTPVSPSSPIGYSSSVSSTTPPPDYPFDKPVFAELDNSLWIIPRPLGKISPPKDAETPVESSIPVSPSSSVGSSSSVRLAFAAIFVKIGVFQIGTRAMVIENKVVQACDATNNELAIPPLQAHIAPPTILHPSSVLSLSPMFNSRDFLLPEKISPKDTETSESLTPVSPSSPIGYSSSVSSTTPPPDYPFDKPVFAELDNSLWIIPRPLGGEPDPDEPNESDAYDHLWK